MKRILISLLSLLIIFTFASCSKEADEEVVKETTKATKSSTTTTKTTTTKETTTKSTTNVVTTVAQNTTTTAVLTTTTKTKDSKPNINIDTSNITIPTNNSGTTRDTFNDTKTTISAAITSAETILSRAKGFCDSGNYNYAITSTTAVSAQMTAAIEACKTDSRFSSVEASLQSCKDQLSGLNQYSNDNSDAAHTAIRNAISNAGTSLSTAKTQLNGIK